MTILPIRRLAGLLLIFVPLAFTICFTLLQMLFEYPDILRQPTGAPQVKLLDTKPGSPDPQAYP